MAEAFAADYSIGPLTLRSRKKTSTARFVVRAGTSAGATDQFHTVERWRPDSDTEFKIVSYKRVGDKLVNCASAIHFFAGRVWPEFSYIANSVSGLDQIVVLDGERLTLYWRSPEDTVWHKKYLEEDSARESYIGTPAIAEAFRLYDYGNGNYKGSAFVVVAKRRERSITNFEELTLIHAGPGTENANGTNVPGKSAVSTPDIKWEIYSKAKFQAPVNCGLDLQAQPLDNSSGLLITVSAQNKLELWGCPARSSSGPAGLDVTTIKRLDDMVRLQLGMRLHGVPAVDIFDRGARVLCDLVVPNGSTLEHFSMVRYDGQGVSVQRVGTVATGVSCSRPAVARIRDQLIVVARSGTRLQGYWSAITNNAQISWEPLGAFGNDVVGDPVLFVRPGSDGERRLVAFAPVADGKSYQYFWYDHRQGSWSPVAP